jgi:TRAP-type uncharacterized transport system substrate-binding protein
MTRQNRTNPLHLIRIAAFVVGLGIAGFAVAHALPPRTITIEAGAVEGSYYQTAVKYRESLRARGIDVKIIAHPDTTQIIDDVNRTGAGVDVGFTIQSVGAKDHPNVGAAGVAELQPMFVFVRTDMGDIKTLSALIGKRIAMPPEASVTSATSLQVLSLFGVTKQNASFSFIPLSAIGAALENGEADAGFLILAPSSPMIAELMADPRLRLLNMPEAKGVSRVLPFLRTAQLPRGSFNVARAIPAEDTTLLAAPINVVIRQDLSPAAVYMLLETMKDVHHGATLISEAGEFPSLTDTNMPPHPITSEYAKSGLPWVYQNLPLPIASLIDRYLIIAIVLLLLKDTYFNITGIFDFFNQMLRAIGIRVLQGIARTTKPDADVTGWRLFVVDVAEHAMFGRRQEGRGKDLLQRIRNGGSMTGESDGAASHGPA